MIKLKTAKEYLLRTDLGVRDSEHDALVAHAYQEAIELLRKELESTGNIGTTVSKVLEEAENRAVELLKSIAKVGTEPSDAEGGG